MEAGLKQNCDMLVVNKNTFTETFPWATGVSNLAFAYMSTAENILADKEKLKECEQIFLEKTSAFSEFRGKLKNEIIFKMAMSENAETYFDELYDIYKIIHPGNYMGSEYEILSAMIIHKYVGENYYEKIVAKMNAYYDRMVNDAKKHAITKKDDLPYITLLACSEQEEEDLFAKMDRCFEILALRIHDSDGVQALSHILALADGDNAEKCARALAVYEDLKSAGYNYKSGRLFSTLGLLAGLKMDTAEIYDLVTEVDDYLKDQIGFATLSVDAKTRLAFSAAMVATYYLGYNMTDEVALLSGSVDVTEK